MDRTLYHRLQPVVRRIQFRRVAVTLALIWIAAAVIAGLCYYQNRVGDFDPSGIWLWLAGGTIVASLVGVFVALVTSQTADEITGEIEQRYPDHDSSLITAIEQ